MKNGPLAPPLRVVRCPPKGVLFILGAALR
ncbi:hypothetical protein ABIE13_002740 [Ottowia thiooxydans]|uniref:Uncharacterized protein n=1 Tax=Ottowia thiooxydans TaxID=219182 RepID=A0ABV2Q9E5_9BURK